MCSGQISYIEYIVGIKDKLASFDENREAELCSLGNREWAKLCEQTHAVYDQDYLGVLGQ